VAEIEVKLFDSMNAAPASQLAVAGWLHGEQNGFGSGDLNMHFSYKAFVAYVKDGHEPEAVGVLTWDTIEPTKTMWIYQAFVVEEHRGQGVFTEMLNFAIAKSIELKLVKIQLATHVRNKNALEVYRKTGFAQQAVTLTLEVPQL
jgi:GNAT superfamily N-acetyltransferase